MAGILQDTSSRSSAAATITTTSADVGHYADSDHEHDDGRDTDASADSAGDRSDAHHRACRTKTGHDYVPDIHADVVHASDIVRAANVVHATDDELCAGYVEL